jgi:hypothetical protein
MALLGGVALGGTYSGVLSRIEEKEAPVSVGISCSRDWRILDRDVSSEGNDASRGSCLCAGPGVVILVDGGEGGVKLWLFGGLGGD